MSRLRSNRHQEGFTLIELSLALALFGVFSALVFKVLTSFIDVSASTEARYANTATAQDLVNTITRQIRLATDSATDGPAFTSTSPSSITFYANHGGTKPETETISVTPGQCPCTVTETRTISGDQPVNYNTMGAVNSDTLFEFYSAPNGTTLSPTLIPISASGATASQLAAISVIGLTATVGGGVHSPPAEVTGMINLPNVAFDYQESQAN